MSATMSRRRQRAAKKKKAQAELATAEQMQKSAACAAELPPSEINESPSQVDNEQPAESQKPARGSQQKRR